MEDDFQLISKKKLKELKQENEKLKQEISKLKSGKNSTQKETSKENTPNSSKTDSENLKKIIVEQNLKLKTEIIEKLKPLEELNKSALNNVVGKIHTIDSDLKEVVKTLSELVVGLSGLIESIPENNKEEPIKENKNSQTNLEYDKVKQIIDNADDSTFQEIKQQLNDIDEFMKNLKILLSNVDMQSIKSKNSSNTQQNNYY